MAARGGRHEDRVERATQEGGAAQDDHRSTGSASTGPARVEREPGTPSVGGEQHWTSAAVESDATSQVLLAITRWFPGGRWFTRRRNRPKDDATET